MDDMYTEAVTRSRGIVSWRLRVPAPERNAMPGPVGCPPRSVSEIGHRDRTRAPIRNVRRSATAGFGTRALPSTSFMRRIRHAYKAGLDFTDLPEEYGRANLLGRDVDRRPDLSRLLP
ncbi:hypothetical protein [Actinopolymorpha alba]|uniref:hypothetical protein n=1 Tax=Actinopolymorpha alba TaxID=533267 RepID=UPI0012F6B2B7|nr:hypothetical protein [Actinopolymorpha alba]